MSRFEIRLCGFGGQGIALAGKILGSAVAIYENKNSVTTQSYGPESRGGASACNIVTSSEEIDFPYVTEPDIFICMSKEAYTTYIDTIKKGSWIFYEEDLVPIDERLKKAAHVYKIPATAIAEKELGRRIVANIVMLGFFAELNDFIDKNAILKAISISVPERFKDLNVRAFNIGISYAKKVKEQEVKK